jgi:hypothetical protein
MTRRIDSLRAATRRLDGRPVLWFGPRGEDIAPLDDLENLVGAASIIAPWSPSPEGVAVGRIPGVALEAYTGTRVDLDDYDLDGDTSPSKQDFVDRILETAPPSTYVMPYRPTTLGAALGWWRRDLTVLSAVAPADGSLDHKPWVETSLQGLGVQTVPWRYLRPIASERGELDAMLRSGPVVLRPDRSSGGSGIHLVHEPAQLDLVWPQVGGQLICAAPFMENSIPVNIGCVVWHDGVSLHPASVQLIGDPTLTTREFGFCGNDFAAVAQLDPHVLDQLEELTIVVGQWLRRRSFRGAFGLDALVQGDTVYFTEINPRLQGSSSASARISRAKDEPCVFLEHLSALLGLSAPTPRKRGNAAMLSNVVFHNTSGYAMDVVAPNAVVDPAPPISGRELVPPPGMRVEPEGPVLRLLVDGSVSAADGRLDATWRDLLVGGGVS